MPKITTEYSYLSERDHILQNAGMFIGNIETEKDVNIITSPSLNKLVIKKTDYNAGFLKIFDEIIVNARDQTVRDPNCKLIKVDIKGDRIIVYNDGAGIPVEKQTINYTVGQKEFEETLYKPTMIFFKLRTSSSYTQTDLAVGAKHGYGAKLTNIFSKEFKVTTWYSSKMDGRSKKNYSKFSQTAYKNMSEFDDPKIESYKYEKDLPNHGTRIEFLPDYKKFGMTKLSTFALDQIRKRCIDIAACSNKKFVVKFNGETINTKDMNDYLELFKFKNTKIYSDSYNDWNVAASIVTKNPVYLGFINGVAVNNGQHINIYLIKIANYIKKNYSDTILSKVTPKIIKQFINIVVNSTIVKPNFGAQVKNELLGKTYPELSALKISNEFLENIVDTKLIKLLKSDLKKDYDKEFEKEEKELKKIKTSNILKYNPPYSKNKMKNYLLVTEGDSAKTLAIKVIEICSKNKTGGQYFGAFPVRGKVKNVRGVKKINVIKNEEIKNLIAILGLDFQKSYSTQKEFETLNYCSLVAFTDADVDGHHIKGLLMNFIGYFWPNLIIKHGFIKGLSMPVIIVTLKNGNHINFYDEATAKNYVKDNKDKIKNYEYYKGLGTVSDSLAKILFSDGIINKLTTYTEKNLKCLEKIFDPNESDLRKEWINAGIPKEIIPHKGDVNLCQFTNIALKEYSIENVKRCLPNIYDGLKPSQRKILYTMFKLKKYNNTKLIQLVGSVIEQSKYHHGDVSVYQTMIGMAQNFVGANNLPYLYPEGQFGSRELNGKDSAAPRYIQTRLQSYMKYLFRKEDEPVLFYNIEEKSELEPYYYIPIIPTILLNGIIGIGTGYSTKIPSYDALDLINKILCYNNGIEFNIYPFIKGYKGKISYDKKNNEYIIKGIWKLNDMKLKIEEIPPSISFSNYKNLLIKYNSEKIESKDATGKLIKVINNDYLIKKYTQRTNGKNISCDIELLTNYDINDKNDLDSLIKKFKLEEKIKFTNLTAIIEEPDYIKFIKYKNIESMIITFIKKRLEYYDKRREYWKITYKKQLNILEEKMRFIKLYLEEKIILKNKSTKNVEDDLEKNNFIKINDNYNYLLNLSIGSLTKDNIQKLSNEIEKINIEIKKISRDNNVIWEEELNELKLKLIESMKSEYMESTDKNEDKKVFEERVEYELNFIEQFYEKNYKDQYIYKEIKKLLKS